MPKRFRPDELAAALAAGPPPHSEDYPTDPDWHHAQDDYLARWKPGTELPDGNDPKRRTEWNALSKKGLRHYEAAVTERERAAKGSSSSGPVPPEPASAPAPTPAPPATRAPPPATSAPPPAAAPAAVTPAPAAAPAAGAAKLAERDSDDYFTDICKQFGYDVPVGVKLCRDTKVETRRGHPTSPNYTLGVLERGLLESRERDRVAIERGWEAAEMRGGFL